MRGRIIFFPLKFIPSKEKLAELEKIQMELKYARDQFLYAIRNESSYQKAIAHIRFMNLVKEKLQVIPGGLCESPEKSSYSFLF